MTAPRQQPNLTTKLASALLALGDVPYLDAKLMSADQLCSLYEFHHNIRHAEDGSIHFANLTPMLRAPHRKRTADIDIPQIAKGKRLRANLAAFNARMAAKSAMEPKPELPKSRWPKGRKLRGRNDLRGRRT